MGRREGREGLEGRAEGGKGRKGRKGRARGQGGYYEWTAAELLGCSEAGKANPEEVLQCGCIAAWRRRVRGLLPQPLCPHRLHETSRLARRLPQRHGRSRERLTARPICRASGT